MITETYLVRIWNDAARELNGKFSMPFHWYNGGSRFGGTYTFSIELNHKNIPLKIESRILELPLKKDEYKDCPIKITAEKETFESIELSIWRKDYLDKLFNFKKSLTGYKDFDRVVGLKASKNIETRLSKVFESETLRKELINDKYRVYNISTENNLITVQRNSGLKMQNAGMFKEEFEKFCLLLESLIDARIL